MKLNKNDLRKLVQESVVKLMKEGFLNYDQLDLDSFAEMYIVGRWFSSEDDANRYLKSVIDKSNDKNISDFIVIKDDESKTLKPYRIYPKPSNIELKRNEASKFVKKYGILSSQDLRYVTYPLYAFVEYKHIDKIKELGVLYRFKPLKEIGLNGVLSRFLKENEHTNNIIGNELKLYNYDAFNIDDENSITLTDIKEIKKTIQELLNKFNSFLGSDYYIVKTIGKETDESIKRGLLNKLDDKTYNPNAEFEKRYKQVSFILERGVDEEEFLAVIEMESIDKPKMFKPISN